MIVNERGQIIADFGIEWRGDKHGFWSIGYWRGLRIERARDDPRFWELFRTVSLTGKFSPSTAHCYIMKSKSITTLMRVAEINATRRVL